MNTALLLIPVFMPFVGGYVSYGIGRKNKKVRDKFAFAIAILELIVSVAIFVMFEANGAVSGSVSIPKIAGMGLSFSIDGFRSFYMVLAAIMWAVTMTLSEEYFDHAHNRNRYYLFNLLTLGATMGVFLSADLYTTFVFFEVMSFVSYVMVVQEENPDAVAGGKLYLGIAVFGGMIMLIGLMILASTLGTVEIASLAEAVKNCDNKSLVYIGGVCAIVGFGAKAGAYPLHIWLPKAHAVAPAPASAILSGILTKTGIYGVLIVSMRIFAGVEAWFTGVLIVGVITMLTGALLALFSINIKRTLACSSVSQIGFILIGVGIMGYSCIAGEEFEHPLVLSSRGTILYMVNHTLVKLLLFLVAGMIYHNMHSLNLNDLRGFGRKKPLLHIQYLIGAFSLMGIPGTCGFIAKSFIHESVVGFTEVYEEAGGNFIFSPEGFSIIEKLFLVGSGMTAAYMIKLYIAMFVEKNENPDIQKKMDDKKQYMTLKSEIGLTLAMLLIPIIGLMPHSILDVLANQGVSFVTLEPVDIYIGFFTWENIKGILICALMGVVIYLLVIRPFFMKDNRYIDAWPKALDIEKFVYMPLIHAICFIGRVVTRTLDGLVDTIVVFLRKTVYKDAEVEIELIEGTKLTKYFGTIANTIQANNNKRRMRKALRGEYNPSEIAIKHKDYVHILAVKYAGIRETKLVIYRTLSFGLLLFCIGFMATIIYLLIK